MFTQARSVVYYQLLRSGLQGIYIAKFNCPLQQYMASLSVHYNHPEAVIPLGQRTYKGNIKRGSNCSHV